MIRLRPFEKMAYEEIRDEYLKQLVDAEAVEFDAGDVLGRDSNETDEKSKNSYAKLADFPALQQYLYDDNKKIIRPNLRQILIGPDEAPRSLGGKGNLITMRSVFEKIILDIEGKSSDISKPAVDVCQQIFKYNRLNAVGKKFSESLEPIAYWLQRQLCVRVCPYCNRMYTTTLYGKNGVRPDFDHFYPQSIYPYLAVSLFNLIPSCNICNKAKFNYAEIERDINKNKKNTTFTYRQKKSIIYPYDEAYNELHMKISFRAIFYDNKVIMGQSDNFTIELRPTEYSKKIEFENLVPIKTELNERFKYKINSKTVDNEETAINSETVDNEETAINEELAFWDRVKNTIDLLRLEEHYNEHKFEIMKIMRIHYEYTQVAKHFIMQPLNNQTATAHMDVLFTRDLLYFASLQPEEWGNSPLNKLKSDILDQLDEIENIGIVY